MDAEDWDCPDNFSEDLDLAEGELDLYDNIKDEILTTTTVADLRAIKKSLGTVSFNSMKRFASKMLLEQMDLEDSL